MSTPFQEVKDDVNLQEAKKNVIEALEKPDFKWRTIPGVVKETGLETGIVLKVLSLAADQVVKSSTLSADGQDLYTTREHFREKASLGERLLGAIRNRAV